MDRSITNVSQSGYPGGAIQSGLYEESPSALRDCQEISFIERPGGSYSGKRKYRSQSPQVVFEDDIGNFNQPFALEWAKEASEIFKKLIVENNHKALADYALLGPCVQLAVPAPECYLPLLYVLALKGEQESITYFNDKPIAGSLTMTSLLIQ